MWKRWLTRVGLAVVIGAVVLLAVTTRSHPGTASVRWRIILAGGVVLLAVAAIASRRTWRPPLIAWVEHALWREVLVSGLVASLFIPVWVLVMGETFAKALIGGWLIAAWIVVLTALRGRARRMSEAYDRSGAEGALAPPRRNGS